MPLLDHFDLLAPLYDRLISRPQELPVAELLAGGSRLLDAGGGTGRIAQALPERSGQIVIVDSSLPMLREARDKGCCRLVAGRAERLPLAKESFDRVMVVDAYHHLADQARGLRELWRVLAPAGRLVIEEPDIDHWLVKLVALAEKAALMGSRFVPAEQIGASLSALGARVELRSQGATAWIIADKPTSG